ncbi:hypothetical protein E2320_006747, partial [Naja naja]
MGTNMGRSENGRSKGTGALPAAPPGLTYGALSCCTTARASRGSARMTMPVSINPPAVTKSCTCIRYLQGWHHSLSFASSKN